MAETMIDRAVAAMIARRNLPEGCDINMAAFEADARAVIASLREPSEGVGVAMLKVQQTPFASIIVADTPELDAIGKTDMLAGNPTRWMMPTWRAAIDAILGEGKTVAE